MENDTFESFPIAVKEKPVEKEILKQISVLQDEILNLNKKLLFHCNRSNRQLSKLNDVRQLN